MGKSYKIVFSIVAVMLYWLAAGGFSNGTNKWSPVELQDETTGFLAFMAEELPFCSDFAVKEGAGYWSAGSVTKGPQKQPQLYKTVICLLQIKAASAVLNYLSQFNIHPVRIRKSDMLFPFHYFFEPVWA